MSKRKMHPAGLTAALLAAVMCPVLENGKPVMKKGRKDGEEEPVLRAVEPDEVLDFAVRDGEVTVVTVQGHKYTGPVPEGYEEPKPNGSKKKDGKE